MNDFMTEVHEKPVVLLCNIKKPFENFLAPIQNGLSNCSFIHKLLLLTNWIKIWMMDWTMKRLLHLFMFYVDDT